MIKQYRICWELNSGSQGSTPWVVFSEQRRDEPCRSIRRLNQVPYFGLAWIEWRDVEPQDAEESLVQDSEFPPAVLFGGEFLSSLTSGTQEEKALWNDAINDLLLAKCPIGNKLSQLKTEGKGAAND